MRRVYLAAGGVFLVLAVIVGWQSVGLRYYTPIGPGPGFFPLWLSGILGLLAVMILVQAMTQPATGLPDDFVPPTGSALRIVGAAAAIFAIACSMSTFGFRITMFVFYAAMLPMLGRRNVIEIVVLAAAGSFGVFEVFGRILKSPLPTGMFGI